MQKPAKTLLWIAMGIEVVYAIAALIAMFIGSTFSPFGMPDSSVYGVFIMRYIIQVGIPMVVKIIFAVIVLFSLKEKSEKIVTEIIAIVTFSGILSFVSILINSIGTAYTAHMIGEEGLVSYSYMNMGMNWVGFLHSISTVLFIVAVSFSIACKKVEFADLRRIIDEEEV